MLSPVIRGRPRARRVAGGDLAGPGGGRPLGRLGRSGKDPALAGCCRRSDRWRSDLGENSWTATCKRDPPEAPRMAADGESSVTSSTLAGDPTTDVQGRFSG